jgi:hypothetical protein
MFGWFWGLMANRPWGNEERAFIKKMNDPTFKVRDKMNRSIARHNVAQSDIRNYIDHVPYFSFEIKNHLEPVVWQYTLATQEMYIEAREGDGVTGDAYRQAEQCRSEIEKKYGQVLDEYLASYVGRPHALYVRSEWHRWYAAQVLSKR